MYVNSEEYAELDYTAYDDIKTKLRKASDRIDILTYNRIVACGFDNLTDFQKKIVKECVCELVEFYEDNKEVLNSALKSYSLNGVSMTFDNSINIKNINGVYINPDIYAKLKQTGLCWRGV